jgi:hypothetical protein
MFSLCLSLLQSASRGAAAGIGPLGTFAAAIADLNMLGVCKSVIQHPQYHAGDAMTRCWLWLAGRALTTLSGEAMVRPS